MLEFLETLNIVKYPPLLYCFAWKLLTEAERNRPSKSCRKLSANIWINLWRSELEVFAKALAELRRMDQKSGELGVIFRTEKWKRLTTASKYFFRPLGKSLLNLSDKQKSNKPNE